MAVTTKRLKALNNLRAQAGLSNVLISLGLAASTLGLSQQSGWWPLSVAVIAMVELWWNRRSMTGSAADRLMRLAVPLVMGIGVALLIALNIRLATQLGIAAAYGLWRWWWLRIDGQGQQFAHLLLVQAVWLEALFLAAAVWRVSEYQIMLAAWLGSYVTVRSVLQARGERSAAVLAAAWALIVTEVAWVLLLWLFTYATPGGYVLVPQPALVLTALAYCFGSIYVAARGGNLSRGRLAEYLAIGLILVVMVIAGTSWRGVI